MNIEDEARWTVRLTTPAIVQVPPGLLQDAVSGVVSSDAFLTYAALFCISDDDMGRPLAEIAKARGISIPRLRKHLEQLETAGWIDCTIADGEVVREFALRFKRRVA